MPRTDSSSKNESSDRDPLVSLFDISWEDVLFCKMFPFLSWKDLYSLGGVSSTGRECLGQYFSTLKSIDLSRLYTFSCEAFQRLTNNAHCLKEICLSDCNAITDAELYPVFEKNKGLISLDLSRCVKINGSCLSSLAKHCKNLKSLNMEMCKSLTHSSLEEFVNFAHDNIHLDEIDFSCCYLLNDSNLLQKFIQQLTSIKKIRLGYISSVDDATLVSISRHCKALTHLDIRGCLRVTDNGIRSIAEYCHELRVISVTNCHLVTQLSLSALRTKGVAVDRPVPPTPSNGNGGGLELLIRAQV